MQANRVRIAVASLALSAAGFIAIVGSESYTSTAVVPTKGDRPTVGFGSTFHENGAPVKLGDTTTPVRALVKAQAHIGKEEAVFRASLDGVSLSQAEYDTYMDWVYQYGSGNWIKPLSPRTWLLKGDYAGACEALLNWRYAAGYDCSTMVNGQPNKRCYGVWTRQLERYTKCMAAQ
ncbi:glycoside hydrolase family protein [Variovorax sp. 278MFTsu5.1]|jgi:GH24 family phage-related lysozyme (muramidase)|uniref:glycoside hydrolase family protein n=1 Tax=Variovorax sp. 278MFTsu5.1 TaxID=3158366 RepID=UPI003AAFE60E